MFPSPVTTTPFSVKDILNLEQQQQGGLAPMELSSPSCMLATFKQEAFGSEPSALPELPEPPPAKPPAAFPGPYYVKSYGEMDTAKDSKADKKGKTAARSCGTALGPLQPGPGARGERELRRSALRFSRCHDGERSLGSSRERGWGCGRGQGRCGGTRGLSCGRRAMRRRIFY